MFAKYWIQIILVFVIVAAAAGWLWSYGNKKWHEGYNKCDAEYKVLAVEHAEKVTVELPKVEKKYVKKLKSVQGSDIPVGPATRAVLDSLRKQYEADRR